MAKEKRLIKKSNEEKVTEKNTVSRRILLKSLLGLPLSGGFGFSAFGKWKYDQHKSNRIVDVSGRRNLKDQLVPIELSSIKVGGEIGRRIDITLENNLLQLDVDKDFLASFKAKDDSGYIGLGKLIDGVVRMAIYSGDEKVIAIKNHLVNEIISAQEPDGYIGNMTARNRMWRLWDIHEMGYIITGLITNYKLCGENSSLVAAEKGADYIIKNWSSMPVGWENTTLAAVHVAITGIHVAMLTLYDVTGNRQYLEFCLKQHDLLTWNPGIVIGRRRLLEGHIYGYLASCLAQLELYRIIPEEKLLGPTMDALNFMTSKNGMSITGGAGQNEIWTDDQDGRYGLGETCATAYQLRIYDNLIRLKGDSRFGDIMERTIYNALFGAQSPEGRRIRYYTPLEEDRAYDHRDAYCCPCNYRRIISELPLMIYYRAGKGVAINLYSASSAVIPIDNGRFVSVKQDTDYPNSGHVVIDVDPSETASFPLKMRIPSWCKNARISVNGELLETECVPGTFTVIERLWKVGDRVVLDMPMEWRLILGRQRQAGRVAVMRGPLLFCLNPDQDESLAERDGADLGRIMIDLESIESVPVLNEAVRANGIGCRVKAGTKPFAMGNEQNITLTLTEFPDPKGKCTYFRVPDFSEAVPDELTELWK